MEDERQLHERPRRPLIFGIDIDGTITAAPRRFRKLIDSLISTGNEVVIVTGRDDGRRIETIELLESLGIQHTRLIMKPIDWPGTIPEYKVMACRRERVDILIDDEYPNCIAVGRETQAMPLLSLAAE